MTRTDYEFQEPLAEPDVTHPRGSLQKRSTNLFCFYQIAAETATITLIMLCGKTDDRQP